MEKERQSRISALTKLPKVNRALAMRLLKHANKKEGEAKKEISTQNPLGDTRFSSMFTDEDFVVDENNPEYIKFHTKPQLNPNKQKSADSEESELEGRASSDESDSDVFDNGADSDEDNALLPKHVKESFKQKSKNKDAQKNLSEVDGVINSSKSLDHLIREGASRDAASKSLSFAKRLQEQRSQSGSQADRHVVRTASGAMSMTFNPTPKSEKKGKGRVTGSHLASIESDPKNPRRQRRHAPFTKK